MTGVNLTFHAALIAVSSLYHFPCNTKLYTTKNTCEDRPISVCFVRSITHCLAERYYCNGAVSCSDQLWLHLAIKISTQNLKQMKIKISFVDQVIKNMERESYIKCSQLPPHYIMHKPLKHCIVLNSTAKKPLVISSHSKRITNL